jgi:transposase
MRALSPNQLRSILGALTQELSYREIAQRTGISKSSIGRVAAVVAQTTLGPEALLQLGDNELVNTFRVISPGRQSEPEWEKIHTQLKRKHMTLKKLHERYAASATGEVYSYPSFCRRFVQWQRDNGLVTVGGNINHVAGERMEVDFAGDSIEWFDPKGNRRESRLFLATLPYSCLIFCEAFDNEKQVSWVNGIVDALEYFGASPQVLVVDNAKALVKTTNWQEAEIQAAIRSLCRYYGMEPWNCKPETPKQKNRVEAAVHDAERWIIAELTLDEDLVALNLQDLNRQILKRVDEINDQPFRGRTSRSTRRVLFESEEKKSLKTLPAIPYEAGDWKLLTVDKGHCVRIASEQGHRYSTPAEYVGKKVAVRVGRNTVEIYDAQTLQSIGMHERCTDLTGNRTHVLEEHLTEKERHYRRTTEEWIALFVEKGIPTALASEFVISLKQGKGKFPSGRICSAVLSLFKRFPLAAIRQAIAAGIEDGSVNYQYIKRLCEQFHFANTTNKELDLGMNPPDQPVEHKNIRNNYK